MQLSRADLETLQDEADLASRRLVRRLGLGSDHRDDLRQDLIVDILGRLKFFNPARGSLSAFVGTVVSHRAARLAARIRRERRLLVTVSLDEPVAGSEDLTLADLVPDRGACGGLADDRIDPITARELAMSNERAFGLLKQPDRELCEALTQDSPTEICRTGAIPRASLYRRIAEIRFRLAAGGLSDAA